ncbi:MAG TPA: SapC family protein [Burkholderiaceae bacterium]|nr:SapC family protein [Burkholderiaceae bacterium]
MIDPNLFGQPTALDRSQHRGLRLDLDTVRFDRTAALNSLFVTAVEFADVCREYPIVFVDAGENEQGKREVAPVAVLGLAPGENLVWHEGRWGARYVPALLRSYPVGMARAGEDRFVVVFDAQHAPLSAEQGAPLFDDNGEPSAALEQRRRFVEEIEREAQRTRMVCRRLQELDLLQPMRFDATLPDGSSFKVDGFMTINEERLRDLKDHQVLELHRTGLLGLIHAHQISLSLMRVLVEKRVERMAPRPA